MLSNNGLPSGNANAVTLGYSYDGAGHLTSVSSTLNDAEHPEVLFEATNYSAVGLTGADYALPTAEGTPAYSQALTYDTRMRLTGETDTATNPTANLPYSYTVGYDGAGNATGVTDSLMGTWTYTPDALNRLSTAVASAGMYAGLTLTESYDVYGNRTNQVPSGSYGGPVPSAMLLTFTGNNNRADQWGYDAAGDVTYDTANMYEYDAEGRQTGVLDPTTGVLTGYIYDAEGQRVEKVLVNGWNTPTPTTTVENEYLLGPNGEQVTVLGVNAAWQWTNVYAGARQLATYDSAGTHFTVTDWLGTKRIQLGVTAASTVTVGEQCTSLPYGDGLNCSGSDVNHLYFTGKERDTESGNDYFLARYYSSNMGGRFLTPDWSKNPQGVPYANYANPQTLNLYAYVGDNPLSLADADGHCTDTTNAPCELMQAIEQMDLNVQQQQTQQQQSQYPDTTVFVHGNVGGCNPSSDALCGLMFDYFFHPSINNGLSLAASVITGGFIVYSKAIQHNNPKPAKGARPVKDKNGKIVGWQIPGKGADKGKLIDKSLEWGRQNGLDPTASKWMMGATGAAATGVTAAQILEGLGGAALAF